MLDPRPIGASGLAAMLALRYGAVPVVYATGGQADPVSDYAEGRRGTGFCFSDYNAGELLAALQRALRVFRQAARWQALQRRGMRQAQQLALGHTAAAYLMLYQQAITYRKEAVTRLSQLLADGPAPKTPGPSGGAVVLPGLATYR